MKPISLNLFMKKLTRERVVPTISARVSWLILGIATFGATPMKLVQLAPTTSQVRSVTVLICEAIPNIVPFLNHSALYINVAAISLTAAWMARSPALLAFGGDSAIELLSAIVVLFRFRAHADQEQSEKRAARIAAVLLF